jgi:Tol biopolymer transport system component
VNADGKGTRQLFGESAVFPLELSPERDRVAYSTGSYISDRLFISRLIGGNERQVGSASALIIQADWSPGGRRIAFSTDDLNLGCRVTVWMATLGSGTKKIADCAGHPAWAPDARRLAYLTVGGQLRVTEVDTAATRVLVTRAAQAVAGAGVYQALAWSPRGDRIAYVGGYPQQKLHVVRVADGKDLAVAPGADGASWSPDGRRLTFLSTGGLAVINRDGTHFRVLDRRALGEIVPAWSPDGRRIAYVRRMPTRCDCRAEVYAISLTGERSRRLTNETATPLDPEEYVQFGPVFWSNDSRRVFYMHFVHFGA